MAFILKDRVLETSVTTGTGTITLAGAVTDYQGFTSAIGAGNTTYYTIENPNTGEWEVGLGTVGTNTLTRDTVLSSSTGSKVSFTAGTKNVFCDYPASKAVAFDANGNITTNCLFEGYVNQAASGTAIVLTAASAQNYQITGSGGQTIRLPNATTLPNGATFTFNNNQSSGTIIVQNNSSTTIATINSGGYVTVVLLDNSTAAGSWDRHDSTPANVSWSTNTLDYAGSITSATWNGNTVAYNRGGTGQSSAFVAGGVVYGASTTAMGVTPVGTAGQVLQSNGASAPTWSTSAGVTQSDVGTAPNQIPLNQYLGTMAYQDEAGVNITGGVATLSTTSVGQSITNVNYIRTTGGATGVAPVIASLGTDADIPLVLQPKGTGALQAQLTDSTTAGGNARGSNAVDWQTSRNSAAQVASGVSSAIGGGLRNTASGAQSAIVGGSTSTSSGANSFIGGGGSNTSNGAYSVIGGGQSNTSAGFFNYIGGGFTNSGTASAAVTTQSGTMNGTTAVTLSGSNASIKVGQLITGTSIASYTYVAAISGTSLTLSQAASGSSTSTLSFYTPHGIVVGGGNNQATGAYSFIGGGGDAGTATNRNVASGDWSVVCGGAKNTASGIAAFIGGGGFDNTTTNANTASGIASVVSGGLSNNSGGLGATIVGGRNNTADATCGTVIGAWGSTRLITGNTVFASSYSPFGTFTTGQTQSALLLLGRQTTDATATVLTSTTSAASGTNQVILPNNSAYYFKGTVIAGVTGAGNSKGWTIEGVIKRGAGVGTTALVGSTVMSAYADAGAVTWTVALSADTTNGGLAVTVTGQASTTIRWVAKVETTEMTY